MLLVPDDRSTDRHSKLMFARKLKCQSLATAYVKNDINQDLVTAVGFSPARNSCVASLLATPPPETLIPGVKMPPPPEYTIYEVVDLISKQGLWNTICNGKECRDNVKEPQMQRDLDAAFARAVANRD